jgi:hypothetical protein
MAKFVSAEIFPGMGICRIGNSQEEYYLAPEIPNRAPRGVNDSWDYRDKEGKILRQAQRFRIYGYTDNKEIHVIDQTHPSVSHIEWKVTLANKKASFYQFVGKYTYCYLEDGPRYDLLRNQHIQDNVDPKNRNLLWNLPFPDGLTLRTDSYRYGDKIEFKGGKIFGDHDAPYLGELRADDKGNLIVLGGRGESKHTRGSGVMYDYVNNDHWYDDTSDGPVEARVYFKDGSILVCKSAWVLTAPPKFPIAFKSLVSLHDVFLESILKKEHVEWGKDSPIAYYRDINNYKDLANRPIEFYRDIAPVLDAPAYDSYVNGKAQKFHGANSNAFFTNDSWQTKLRDNSDKNFTLRDSIFHRIRVPLVGKRDDFGNWVFTDDNNGMANEYYMPMLAGDGGEREDGNTPTFFALPGIVYNRLEKWRNGDFSVGELDPFEKYKSIEEIPITEQPYCLDLATLQWTIGGPFCPGIEMTWISTYASSFSEPFRITRNWHAGDVTRAMAIPWQADFYECQVHWWPSARPDIVIEESIYDKILDENPEKDVTKLLSARVRWAMGIRFNPSHKTAYGVEPVWGDMDMVKYWDKLGFIVPKPTMKDGIIHNDMRKNVFVQTGRSSEFRPYNEAIDPLKPKSDINFGQNISNTLPKLTKLGKRDAPKLKALILDALQVALKLELSTIPPYLFALYSINYLDSTESNDLSSIKDDDQVRANQVYGIVKSVAVEEMLHAAIVANIITSLGDVPKFYSRESIMDYPCLLPNYRGDLMLNLWPATNNQIQNFANLEKPDTSSNLGFTLWFDSIGDFYMNIQLALTAYFHTNPDALKTAKSSEGFQVNNGMAYYPSNSDSGFLSNILELKDALNSIEVIRKQGEGQMDDTKNGLLPTDDESGSELSHYAKFVAILEGDQGYLKKVNTLANGNVCVGLEAEDQTSRSVVMTNKAFSAAYCLLLVALDNLYRTRNSEKKLAISRRLHFPIMKVILPQLSKILMTVPLVRVSNVDNRDWTEANAGPTFEFIDFAGKNPVKFLKQCVKESKGLIEHELWDTVSLTVNNLPEDLVTLDSKREE